MRRHIRTRWTAAPQMRISSNGGMRPPGKPTGSRMALFLITSHPRILSPSPFLNIHPLTVSTVSVGLLSPCPTPKCKNLKSLPLLLFQTACHYPIRSQRQQQWQSVRSQAHPTMTMTMTLTLTTTARTDILYSVVRIMYTVANTLVIYYPLYLTCNTSYVQKPVATSCRPVSTATG